MKSCCSWLKLLAPSTNNKDKIVKYINYPLGVPRATNKAQINEALLIVFFLYLTRAVSHCFDYS